MENVEKKRLDPEEWIILNCWISAIARNETRWMNQNTTKTLRVYKIQSNPYVPSLRNTFFDYLSKCFNLKMFEIYKSGFWR